MEKSVSSAAAVEAALLREGPPTKEPQPTQPPPLGPPSSPPPEADQTLEEEISTPSVPILPKFHAQISKFSLIYDVCGRACDKPPVDKLFAEICFCVHSARKLSDEPPEPPMPANVKGFQRWPLDAIHMYQIVKHFLGRVSIWMCQDDILSCNPWTYRPEVYSES